MPETCYILTVSMPCALTLTVPLFLNPVLAFLVALILVVPFLRLIARILEILPG